jgi:hypothetical protein
MSVAKLLEDLDHVLQELKAESGDKKGDDGQMVALYGKSPLWMRPRTERPGMGQTSVGPYVVGKAAEIFLDALYD